MNQNVKAAGIVAIGLIVASLLLSGIYTLKVEKDGLFVWRLNRLTGDMTKCTAYDPIALKEGKDAPPSCFEASPQK